MLPEAQVLTNFGGLVVLAGLGLYLVKVVVNDLKHDVSATRAAIERAADALDRIENLLRRPP